MAAREQSGNQTTPSDHEDMQQAELFAASAAEGAITDRKDPSVSEDLHQLTLSTEQVSLDDAQRAQSSEPPSTEEAPSDPKDQPDRVLSKEELVEEALNCPCIASMRDGPCGDSFISAYKCFLESETDPKGMDCMDQFKGMQACIAEHPEEYNLDDDDDDDADPFAAQKTNPPQDQHTPSPSPASEKPDPNLITPPTSASS